MFTGIIQEIGQIIYIEKGEATVFKAACSEVLKQLKIGDSVAINGACQTVSRLSTSDFSFYSSTETLSITNFNDLKIGAFVNLEKPLTLNTLLDGHIVQGHIDGTAIIKSIENKQNEYHIDITCPKELLRYLIHKGSVAVDGVSLTINRLYETGFSLTVIPVTFDKTIFRYAKTGDTVNIEVDLFAKYVEKFLNNQKKRNIDKDFLMEHGFF